MSRKYFGTDGVRGRVGEHPITPQFVMHLGYAAGRVLSGMADTPGERTGVLIGKDTRISGYMLESALEAGLIAAGIDVYLAGPVPTPAVAYLTRALRLQAGIVISASHNPFDDNGIKFFSSHGAKLPDETELAIEAAMDQEMKTNASDGLGKAKRIDDAAGRYIEFCKSTFPTELDLRGLKIVVDSAHGATYQIARHVFHELGADVIAIGAQPDGRNINDGYGATAPDNLRKAVVEHNADIGIALDGDGDRLVMADSAGKLYDGDQLMYVIARHRQAQGMLHGGVVGTLMTNLAFEHAMQKLGIPFMRAKVGRPIRVGIIAAKGLAARRRKFRAYHLSGQAQHRRRHHLRAAGAACIAREWAKPRGCGERFADVPSSADQRQGRQGTGLPRRSPGDDCGIRCRAGAGRQRPGSAAPLGH